MLTSAHTDLVRDCAVRVATERTGHNELALYERVYSTHKGVFSRADLWIMQFCAEAVANLDAGALVVSNFFCAWKHAQERAESGSSLNRVLRNELKLFIQPAKGRATDTTTALMELVARNWSRGSLEHPSH